MQLTRAKKFIFSFSKLRKWARIKRLLRSSFFSGLLLFCSCQNPNSSKLLNDKSSIREDQIADQDPSTWPQSFPVELATKMQGRYKVIQENCSLDNFPTRADKEISTLELLLDSPPKFQIRLRELDFILNPLTEISLDSSNWQNFFWNQGAELIWSNCPRENHIQNCSLRRISLPRNNIADLAYEIKTQFKIGLDQHIYRCNYLLVK